MASYYNIYSAFWTGRCKQSCRAVEKSGEKHFISKGDVFLSSLLIKGIECGKGVLSQNTAPGVSGSYPPHHPGKGITAPFFSPHFLSVTLLPSFVCPNSQTVNFIP